MQRSVIGNLLATLWLLLVAGQANAQNLAGTALVEALREGGLVFVMRHTSSPRGLPDARTVNPDNVNGERQLDEKGRLDATAMGEALRRLQIPVGEVLSSPAYRALETAQLAGLDEVTVQQELGNEGMAESSAQYAEWLRNQVAAPAPGRNRLLITHGPNISAAFAEQAVNMEEGDTLVFDPQSGNGPTVVARIKSADWSTL